MTSQEAVLTVASPIWGVTASASSEYSSGGWSAACALGVPDTGSCGSFSTAWTPRGSGPEPEWLEIGFGAPWPAVGLQVHETHLSGCIYQADLVDANGVRHTIWTGADTTPCPGWFTLTFPRTPYLVKAVPPVPVTPWIAITPAVPAGSVTLACHGESNRVLEVLVSTDLRNWTVLTTLTNTSGQAVFADKTTGLPCRFYRLRQLP